MPGLRAIGGWTSAINLILAAGIFALDLRYPPGVNVPALYILPVLLTFWQPRRFDPFLAAAGCSILSLVDLAFWSSTSGNWGFGAINRVLAVIGIWVTAILVERFKRAGERGAQLAEEIQRAQAQAREQAELARLGRMSALIAHEVRNPLAGIRGAVDIIARRLPPQAREQAVLVDVVERLDDLNAFVGDLLTFARPHPLELRRASITAVLRRLTALVAADPAFAGIRVTVTGRDAEVQIDAAQIERALLNLVANAAHAMDGDGEVSIRIEQVDGWCRVLLRDTGSGMSPDVLDKIFEPFFTTRHRGTGLGLPIGKRTVEQHGGRLRITSTAGEGTTAIVELPLAPALPTSAPMANREEPALAAGGGAR
jgi:signal transduction histidine kinase